MVRHHLALHTYLANFYLSHFERDRIGPLRADAGRCGDRKI